MRNFGVFLETILWSWVKKSKTLSFCALFINQGLRKIPAQVCHKQFDGVLADVQLAAKIS